ncbi:MAG: tripartite tricarboxylate transporter permease [Planctomycetota bacterium]|jgi:putative tricarboxylic transport membrane protein|nr:tripartite tricarboxylate transporter permease [Planctomycetota bacterium]
MGTPEAAITFYSFLNPVTLWWLFASTFLGIVIGALPGLTATMGVSLLVSLTLGLGTVNSMVVLIGVFLGGIYGGSRSAILLNVPGTPSSAATAIEGFPLALKGEGTYAGVVVTTCSTLGGVVGMLILWLATPWVAKMALAIGYWEYFWLGMFGIVISGSLVSDKWYKGLISGMAGLFISAIGIDGIYGISRFDFDSTTLKSGISLVPAMIGLFGLTEAFTALSEPESHLVQGERRMTPRHLFGTFLDSFVLLFRHFRLFLQSSVIGTLIGALPGTGSDIAAWVAYDAAKRTSKRKELFGKGSWEGIIGAETSNNACTSGVFIPVITLGVAGDAVSAIIMGGLQLHGYRPGPTFLMENPGFLPFLCAVLLAVNLAMLIQGVLLTPIIGKVLQLPVGVIMPMVVLMSVVGSYAVNIRAFDIGVMVFFGFMGFVMKKLKIPAAPMALGIILGSLVELNFRRGLMAGKYSILPFFTRPVSTALFLLLAVFIVWPIIRNARRAGES